MAAKTSDLVELLGANVAADDLLYIVDTSSGVTGSKKIKISETAVAIAGQLKSTGWTAGSGTHNRGSFSAYSAPTISGSYTQAEVQALADALQATARRLYSLEADLRAKGMLAT